MEFLEHRALLSTVTVHVFNFDFSTNPKGQPIVDPTIHVGDTVHWVWDEGFHSTTSVAGQAESWDSGSLATAPNVSFDHTFTHSGTFTYYCTIHGHDLGNGTASGMAGTITVLPTTTLTSIAVTPSNPGIVAGTTEQFTATGTFSDNSTQDLTSQVTWASADASVATVSNIAGSRGLATALAAGTSTISATLGTVTGSTLLTVTAATLDSIAVTPANPSLAVGRSRQFTAMGSFSNGTTQDLTTQVTWASANTALATISNAPGSQGLASALATGTSSITATLGTVTGTTVLTVVPAPTLASIMVMPENPGIIVGTTDQFMAMGTFSDGSTSDLTGQVVWSSSNTSVATISNAAGSQGLANGVGPGSASIVAQLDGISGSTTLTVNPHFVTVTNVRLVLNKRRLVTQIIVSFSGAVNVNEADAVATYRLATAGKNGSFDARNAGIIKLKSAALAGSTNTVTLTPKKAFALSKTVQFRINGLPRTGLQDSLGRLIDGDHNGQPGGNAIALLKCNGVTLS